MKFGWIGERMAPELNLSKKVEIEHKGKIEDITITPPSHIQEAEEADFTELN